jgi:hypothetical protein
MSIRGFKIRGAYETLDEACKRAASVKRTDARFHVYVAEVGCWCPWSPNPDDISDAQYSEQQLNRLMKGYRESQELRDEDYDARKKRMMTNIAEDRDSWIAAKARALGVVDESEEAAPEAAPEGGKAAAQ